MATTLPASFAKLRWRCIGPHRGGRVSAVAGDPTRPLVFYFGGCAGGIWKTEDAGITWVNVSDGFLHSASVGDIAVAPSDPNVVYAAMGEAHIRGNIVSGDGVYRSTDGGRTWIHLGLADTRHIGRIRVHPQDPDLVYVAALGHAFGPNAERGVFRSRDGGRTWQKVLYRNEDAGAIDLAMDASNPRILYAAFWEARRGPHFLSSGGPGSGLFKSVDGGDSWTEITDNPGLPKGVKGKIGVAVSPARPSRVWALVEAEEGGLFRSEDYGDTWKLINGSADLRGRPFYYTHVFADPKDADRLYVLNFNMWKSTNGGASFTQIHTPHGDNHGLWIDPNDPERMIEGNDGGACISQNGGRTWSSIYNQPTAQFYHVTTDTRYPYRVYGAQQDNMTITVPSRSDNSGIGHREYYDVGGAESGYIQVRADNPDIVYAGSSGGGEGGRLTRYDHRLRQRRDVTAWPQKTAGLASEDYTYRWQWTSPIHLSPHDPNILYSCANRVFRSTDEGSSWELISPDLTRNDPSRLGPSGGPITKDHTGVEVYCTVFAFAESSVRRGLLWAGSDDGLIHVSRDDGKSWENVTPPASLLPEWAMISIIEPSPHDAGTAYVAATRYKMDDNTPYLLKTSDYGKSWKMITGGIPAEDFTRAIREDPVKKGLLFAGTESGIYVSFDDGGAWHRLNLNLPVVPIHDLEIKDDDLVVATHGRSFWILDDMTPLRQGAKDGLALYAPKPTVRFRLSGGMFLPKDIEVTHPVAVMDFPAGDSYYLIKKPENGESAEFADVGQNPPDGMVFNYVLPSGVEEATLTVRTAAGAVVRTFSSKDKQNALPTAAGANRFIWNLRHEGAKKLDEDEEDWGDFGGPLAVPGSYQAELAAGGKTVSQAFEIVKDPRVGATQADLEAQMAFGLEVVGKVNKVRDAVKRSRAACASADEWVARTRDHPKAALVAERAEGLKKALTAIEEQLMRPKPAKGTRPMGQKPRIDNQLTHLLMVAGTAEAAPTKQTLDLYAQTAARADELCTQLEDAIRSEGHAFEGLLREAEIPAIG
jgi:photosystem II stability/assembly factor-like uncharacterized protein